MNNCTLEPHISEDATPFLRITLAEPSQVMSPNTARELAVALIEMAAAVEYEAAIIKRMKHDNVGTISINRFIASIRHLIKVGRTLLN